MFHIIQSNDIAHLAKRLTDFYRNAHLKGSVFDEFVVIVPALVLDDWLKKQVASQVGVSTLITSQFWGQYQWQLIDRILRLDADYLQSMGRDNEMLFVPEVAVLSGQVLKWRLFGYFTEQIKGVSRADTLLKKDKHPLYELLVPLADKRAIDGQYKINADKLWQLCDSIANLYVAYLTERPDWLQHWAADRLVNVAAMIAQKDRLTAYFDSAEDAVQAWLNQDNIQKTSDKDGLDDNQEDDYCTPVWLVEHYQSVEKALRFLWQELFSLVYKNRQGLEERFWQVLSDSKRADYQKIKEAMPHTLYLFTVQQLPQIELDFLKRLSVYTDIVLLHFNPSALFWADIVDKNWLVTQTLIRPSSVYLKDYGHELLSVLGKASRESFAMLAELSGNEMATQSGQLEVVWEDEFNEWDTAFPTLLTALKKDILMLDDIKVSGQDEQWEMLTQKIRQSGLVLPNLIVKQNTAVADDSLVIHSCHSLKRQLEIARLHIGRWLNIPNPDGSERRLSDIAIMLPDVASNHGLIRSVFGTGVGIDGLVLPAKITGVADELVGTLWQAISGIYTLTAKGRFASSDLYDWLMLPPVYECFGLGFEGAKRACYLLNKAGFIRGFNEAHLKQTLDVSDSDYRRTFAYALDRLTISLLMMEGVSDVLYPFDWQDITAATFFGEKTQTLPEVCLEDELIIQSLCQIYTAFHENILAYHTAKSVTQWIEDIEKKVIERYFYLLFGSEPMRSVFGVINSINSALHVNRFEYERQSVAMPLPLKFVLDTIQKTVDGQQISAEPSGVITFGRFGSLRSIPFSLIIMLDMNLSEFPRTDPVNRLDLRQAGLKRRGDRVSEDDDNGAFLEAILLANQACWIFYTGQNATDGTELLPATPVSELIQYLKSIPFDKDNAVSLIDRIMVYHSPLPFHKSIFEKTEKPYRFDLPPPIVWQSVYDNFAWRNTPKATIRLPTTKDVDAIERQIKTAHIANFTIKQSAAALARAVSNPATTYLKGKLSIHEEVQIADDNEPLQSDGLTEYSLRQMVLDSMLTGNCLSHLPYGDKLPAGVARILKLEQIQQQISTLICQFASNLIEYGYCKPEQVPLDDLFWITPTADTDIQLPILNALDNPALPSADMSAQDSKLPNTLTLTATIPSDTSAPVWYAVSASKPSADKLVSAYIHHLCWQCVLDGATKGGVSLWQFMGGEKQSFMGFKAVNKKKSQQILAQWITASELMQMTPIVLPSASAIEYLTQDSTNPPKFTTWMSTAKTTYISKDNHRHKYWRTILGDEDVLSALEAALPLAKILYGDFMQSQLSFN